MASLIPISTYNLALEPFNPVPALDEDFPVTVRLTLAAVDPEAVDDKEEPSTVRILKRSRAFIDSDDEDLMDIEAEDDEDDELDSEEEQPKEAKAKKGKKAEKEEDNEEEDEDEDESDIEDDDEIEEFVLCTLSPKVQFQQTLDFTISPAEEVHFVVTGSYAVHLSGNYVEHPADDEDDYDSDELDDDYYNDLSDDEEAYGLSPDEDELVHIDGLGEESSEEEEGKIEELPEEKPKKRAAEEASEPKKAKKAKEDKKKVQFTKELEQGPTPSKKEQKKNKKDKKEDKPAEAKEDKKDKKYPTNTLLGGVVTEDRKVGTGAAAKSGNKVGIRYIGKLKNGKVFDKNTSGKPFVFNLGKGECIKGFDLGVAGMTVGGERRVIIPAKMGYGSQALPGIPANSELTFDIKLVSLK